MLKELANLFARGHSSELVRELVRLFPNDPHRDQVHELVRFVRRRVAATLDWSGTDRLFLDNIAEAKHIRTSLAGSGVFPRGASRKLVGPEADFLAEQRAPQNWGLARCVNYLLMNSIPPRRAAAVVGTMRDDGISALEWIAHYLVLGFEHIFIYTNDNMDGSDALLRCLAAHEVITLIENRIGDEVSPQIKAFEHAIHLLPDLREFEWVFFLDSDEFFVPGAAYGHSVHNVLAALHERCPDRLPSAICYQWLWFVSGFAYGRTPGLLMERFQHARPHRLLKSLVRLQDVVDMHPVHFPFARSGGFIVDAAFSPIDMSRIWDREPASYDGGQVNHYWTRSFEEFSVKKARGDAVRLKNDVYRRDFGLFFAWNDPESGGNRWRPDAALLARIKTKMADLTALAGVHEALDEVEHRFPALLARFDAAGGLRRIYEENRKSRPAV